MQQRALFAFIISIGLGLAGSLTISDADAKRRKDPRPHALDDLASAIDAGVETKLLRARECMRESGVVENFSISVDSAGRVRRYYAGYGSGDSVLEDTTYYDAKGRPRLVRRTGGAVNDTSLDERAYYSAGGALIRHRKNNKGPGYTFPEIELVKDPKGAFKRVCPKTSARP